MKKISIDKKLSQFGEFFTNAGFNCYLVGGAVRNKIAGLPPSDYDFTTDATPQEVMKLFKKVIPIGIQHGTVAVLFKGESYEVTTFRIEEGYSDSRRPDKVIFSRNINEDLSRRDFTINAIAANLTDGVIIDPFNGQKDIKNKCLKAIGTPKLRFEEDGLRILRLFRFAATLNYKIESETLDAACQMADKLKKISPERIRDEFTKILLSEDPSYIINLMQEKGILALFLPELCACVGVSQNEHHLWDVYGHSLHALSAMRNPSLELRLAALLHDIAKPLCIGEKDGKRTFYNHEKKSALLAKDILTRLKFTNQQIKKICHLIDQHMYLYTPDWSDKAVRRFIERVGIENIKDLFELTKADRFAHKGQKSDYSDLIELLTRIEEIIEKGDALSIKDLAINGSDLIAVGASKGPSLGIILNELLDAVMEDPENNTREKLLNMGKILYKQYNP